MEIKKYKAGDEIKILELFKLAFNKEMLPDYWKWRFHNNPFTERVMIHLMWDGDKLVGHYAICPIEMVIDGVIRMTAFSMTTMTHPEYNGRGIFTQLSSSLYEELKSVYGYAMVWGFPNNNSHYAFVKNLKWNNVATIPMLSLPITRLKAADDVNFTIKTSFDDSMAALLSATDKAIRINKTTEYMKWRYIVNPFAEYKILAVDSGLIVYKVIPSFTDAQKSEIDILELFYNDDLTLLNKVLNAVVSNENSDIKQFNMWSSIFDKDYLNFEKFGFTGQTPITYLGYFNLASESSLPHNYSNWDINFGYSDVF